MDQGAETIAQASEAGDPGFKSLRARIYLVSSPPHFLCSVPLSGCDVGQMSVHHPEMKQHKSIGITLLCENQRKCFQPRNSYYDETVIVKAAVVFRPEASVTSSLTV